MGRSTRLLRGGQSNRDRLFKVVFIYFSNLYRVTSRAGLFNFLIAVIDCNFLLPIFQRNFSIFFFFTWNVVDTRGRRRRDDTHRNLTAVKTFFSILKKKWPAKENFRKIKKRDQKKTKNVPGFFTAVCVSEHITGNEHGREERPNEFGCVIVHDSAESFKLLKITPAVSFIFPRLSRWDKCGCLFFFFKEKRAQWRYWLIRICTGQKLRKRRFRNVLKRREESRRGKKLKKIIYLFIFFFS